MKRLLTIFTTLVALAIAQTAYSQDLVDIDDDPGTETHTSRGRIGVQASFKLPKNFQLSVTGDAWFKEFRNFDRLNTTFGLTYRPLKYLRFGASYGLTSLFKTNDEGHYWDLRHRFTTDVTGLYTTGGWTFSLTERFQAAPRPDGYNPYRYQKADLMLRTRFNVGYKFENVPLEPLLSVDMRTLLNGVDVNTLGLDPAEAGSVHPRFNHVACDRYKVQASLTYRIDKHNALQLYYSLDIALDHPVYVDEYGVIKKDDQGNYRYYFDKTYTSTAGLTYKFSI